MASDTPSDRPDYQIRAQIDMRPNERAKTDFTTTVSSDRSLRAKLHHLHRDGYRTTVRLPGGRVVPGRMFPGPELMEGDHGYAPRPEYGDNVDGGDTPVGFDSEFTNQNTTYMCWNLMHMAMMIKRAGGIPSIGNTAESWHQVANAADVDLSPTVGSGL